MPSEKRDERKNEKSGPQAGIEPEATEGETGAGEREVQSNEPPTEKGNPREERRERREMEGGDPRVGRGGDPVSAGREEDKEDPGDAAVTTPRDSNRRLTSGSDDHVANARSIMAAAFGFIWATRRSIS